jgi:hypothetical protein
MTTLITVPHYAPVYNVHVSLNGFDNFVSCQGVQDFPQKEFTIECWINSSATKSETLMNYSAGGQPTYILLGIQNITNLEFYINMMESGPTGINVADGKWHLLSVTWTSFNGNLNVYLDGVRQNTAPIIVAPNGNIESNGTLLLGQSSYTPAQPPPADALAADLADYRLWNRARTAYFIKLDSTRTLMGSDVGTIWQNVRLRTLVNNTLREVVFSCAAVATERSVMLLDSNHGLWISSDFGKTIVRLPNPSVNMAYIAGTDGGTSPSYIGLDVNGGIWVSVDIGTTWTNVPGALVQTSIWSDIRVGVNSGNLYYYYPSTGNDWIQGGNVPIICTAVNESSAWGINTNNQLLISPSRTGTDWTQVVAAPPLLKIAASSTMLQGIGLDGTLYASGTDGSSWRKVSSLYGQPFFNGSMLLNVCWAVDTAGRLMFGELDTQMIVHWQFDEGYGNLAYDSSNHDNHGIFGADLPETIPSWEVASMLMPPGFVYDSSVPVSIANSEEMVDYANEIRLASAGGDIPHPIVELS